jgi:hypothetical protein
MPETYLLRAHLLCHDVRLNTSIEIQVALDHSPTEKEAIQFLCVKAEEEVTRNFCEGCPYELSLISIQLVQAQ